MAIYDLNQGQLNGLLAIDGVSPHDRKMIIDFLKDEGDLGGHGGGHNKVEVQVGGSTLDGDAQVLITSNVPGDLSGDPSLKVIVSNDSIPGGFDGLVVPYSGDISGGPIPGHGHGHDDDGWSTMSGGGGDHGHGHGHGDDSWSTISGGGGDHSFLGGSDTGLAGTGGDTPHGPGPGGHDNVLFDVGGATDTNGSNNQGHSADHGVTTVQFGGDHATTISGPGQLVFTDEHGKH